MSIEPLTYEQSVRLAVVTIREALKLGPDRSRVSTTERIMVAFAACDRSLWLSESTSTTAKLWQQLDDRQREALTVYLNS